MLSIASHVIGFFFFIFLGYTAGVPGLAGWATGATSDSSVNRCKTNCGSGARKIVKVSSEEQREKSFPHFYMILQIMESQTNFGPNRSINLIKVGINGHSRKSEQWKQMGDAEKKVVVNSEIKRMKELLGNSTYATHRLWVLNKVIPLMSNRACGSMER